MYRSPKSDFSVIPVAVLFIFTSCTYNPSGTNFQEKDDKVLPVNVVFSLEPALETDDILKIADRVEYSYRVFPNGRSNLWLSLQLGTKLLENRDLTQSELNKKHTSFFVSQEFADGLYDLKLVITANSGTGSLADLTQNENVQFTQIWKVEIDNAPPTAPQIENIESSDGTLRLIWNPYVRPRFDYYQVMRINEAANSEHYRFPENVIFNRYTTTATDPGFIGGKATYAIVVGANYSIAIGELFSVEESYPTFKEFEINGSELFLSWSDCRYPDNFGKYVLQETYESGHVHRSWEFDNAAHTSHTIIDYSETNGFSYRLITMPRVPFQNWNNQTIDTIRPSQP